MARNGRCSPMRGQEAEGGFFSCLFLFLGREQFPQKPPKRGALMSHWPALCLGTTWAAREPGRVSI